MGEVYRARDARLDRQVAIKILPVVVANDPERRARFEREARALAALNHPNIAQIYGAEEIGDTIAIVMELVEGEDLATRIARGPMPWPHVQPIARQLADALDAAHERGIVHRDLKPANIRLTSDDTVKVLDFGLAKAISGTDALQQDPGLSPTVTSPPTRLGTIIGSPAYMSPEQAKGKTVDKRTDIWAFGCVLFEMLTGLSPFASETAAESLGLVVMKDPDWGALPSSVPPRSVELIRHCLVKDPRHRLRDIGDAAFALAQPETRESPIPAVPAAQRRRGGLIVGGAVILAAVAAALAWWLKPSAAVPLRRLELPSSLAASGSVAVSPDGTRLAYFADGRIFVRDLRTGTAHDVGDAPPTSDRIFWSPDSRTIGYAAQGTLRTMPADGGPLFTVCRIAGAGRIMGAAWRSDGTIVFSAWRENLYAVSASGGTPNVLLTLDPATEIDFHDVSPAPGGDLIVAVHLRREDAIRFDLLAGKERRLFVEEPTARDFRYVAPGGLMFRRIGDNQGLWWLPYSSSTPQIANAVLIEAGATSYTASAEGTLIVRSEVPPVSTLAWVAWQGSSTTTTSIPGKPIPDLQPVFSLSPQGDRVAYVAGQRPAAAFIRDLATGTDARLSPDSPSLQVTATDQLLTYPSWFPGGDRVLLTAGPVESSKLVAHRANGGGEPVPLGPGMWGRASPDGKWLAWLEDNRGQGRLHYAPLTADGRIGEPRRTFEGLDKLDIRAFDLSPDSRLITFSVRDSTGQLNVNLAEFPRGAGRWQVTTGGGTSPRFSRDGRELLFLTGARTAAGRREGALMTLPLIDGPPLKLGVPRVLLSGDATPAAFDTARDGRLLAARRVETTEKATGTWIQNWPAFIAAPRPR